MSNIIIGFVGFIGCGKDTAADYLVNFHGFRRDSFANTLKDAISAVFGWDRTLMEGRTAESRRWREEVDTWWANRLNIPHLTPRWVMQNWGTDVLRNNFHDDIWIASLENKVRKTKDNIVISDVRFPNEIKSIHNSGGIVVRIQRGQDPEWMDAAAAYMKGPGTIGWAISKDVLNEFNVHASEYSWVGSSIDYTVTNNDTIDDLFNQISSLIKNQELNPPASTDVHTCEALADS